MGNLYSSRWNNFRQRALCLALMLALLATMGAAQSLPPAVVKAQPELLALAAQQPERQVRVIVQQTAPNAGIARQVQAVGGQITADLNIINAFAATMPAGKVPQVASAAGVRWISLDAPVKQADAFGGKGDPSADSKGSGNAAVDVSKLANTYIKEIGADKVWNGSPSYLGNGIGVAVVDSGMEYWADFYTTMGQNRIVASVRFNGGYNQSTFDGYGHGTHVGGIVGANGNGSGGSYIGVAPGVNLINVKVSDDVGAATASSVVQGLQWVKDNRSTYNIRIVNLSLNSSVAQSYNKDPIAAAVEILWFNKIVVVVSAGNNGSATLYPPANDPFVITVGAVDGKNTAGISDDVMASYSAYGTTSDGFAKPDLVAPGSNIVSTLASTNASLATGHAANIVKYNNNPTYFRMSGTSMAAPMVAGAAALLLQSNPNLNPDQVKYRLKSTANKSWTGYNATKAGAGLLDVYAAVRGTSTTAANTGTKASQLLSTGSTPITWGSVNWNSVNWNTVNWNSVNWNSVNWNSVNWNSDYWGP